MAFGRDEMFRDGIRKLVDNLEETDVPTTSLEESGMFHVFPILMPWAEASHRVLAAVSTFVEAELASAAPGRRRTRRVSTTAPLRVDSEVESVSRN